jgi:hypothetical protein
MCQRVDKAGRDFEISRIKRGAADSEFFTVTEEANFDITLFWRIALTDPPTARVSERVPATSLPCQLHHAHPKNPMRTRLENRARMTNLGAHEGEQGEFNPTMGESEQS